MKIRTGLIVAGGGLLLLTASANAQMRGGGFHGGFGGMHGAPWEVFVVVPWEVSAELKTGFVVLPRRSHGRFHGAPNGGFRGGPTAAAHNGHGHNGHHHGNGNTRVVVGFGFPGWGWGWGWGYPYWYPPYYYAPYGYYGYYGPPQYYGGGQQQVYNGRVVTSDYSK